MDPGARSEIRRSSRRRAWSLGLAGGLLLAGYLAVPNLVQSGDNHAHCLTALSLVQGDWGFLDHLRPYWASAELGVRATVIEVGDGRTVGGTGMGAALLLAPFYALARVLGAGPMLVLSGSFNQLIAALFCASAVVAFWVAVRRLGDSGAAWLATIALALGSSMLSVLSREPWQHTFVVALQALALAVALRPGQPSARWRSGVAGGLVGIAGLVRATGFVYALPWWWLLRRQGRGPAWPFWTGLGPGVVLTLGYNWLVFGSPFLFGQIVIGRYRFASGASQAVSWNPLTALAGLLVSPGRGLFVYSPVFLWALGALAASWMVVRRHRLGSSQPPDGAPSGVAVLLPPALLAIGLNILGAAAWKEWAGGFTYGPRYLSDTLPFWGLVVAAAVIGLRPLAAARRRFALALAWPLLALSVVFHMAGLLVNPYRGDAYSARIDPDHHPERLWGWRDFPPLDNLRRWRSDRKAGRTPGSLP
ncbi:MAG TPA: hypothetical protein PKL08_00600 [Thermoanaerobaculaceae bacterium]|nr:hypothetical protein [Thermoanaerobaculaceae bacterium]